MQVALPFLDPVAFAIVAGGTMVAIVFRTPGHDLIRAMRALRILGRPAFRAEPLIEQVAALSRIARRHGVVALDRTRIVDPDVRDAVECIVDGADERTVASLLARRRDARIERHLGAAEVWAAIAEIAPAMGMIGTLVGLVRMFAAMADPSAIGHAMAVALLTTLYGALLATLVAMPIAGRLRRLARIEAVAREQLVDPLSSLAAREKPHLLATAA